MIAKQSWQQAKEEFGNDAAMRFDVDLDGMTGWWPAQSNIQVESFLSRNQEWIRLKPLKELAEHDKEYYGEDEYFKMWQWRYIDGSNDWQDCNKPLSFKNDKEYRRKKSAGLKFDLERAVNGDIVEFLVNGEWNNVNFRKEAFPYIPENEYNLLRMKYPPKKATK